MILGQCSASPRSGPPPAGFRHVRGLPVPAGSDDEVAHGLYRILLEDIATAGLDGGVSEAERLHVLAELDRLEVVSHSRLGRHLITTLEQLTNVPAHEVGWRHRRLLLGGGRQLTFRACSRFDDTVHEASRCWVQLRHHDLQRATGTIDQFLTIPALLTSQPDGDRRWDTIPLAVHGDPGACPASPDTSLRR